MHISTIKVSRVYRLVHERSSPSPEMKVLGILDSTIAHIEPRIPSTPSQPADLLFQYPDPER